MSFRPTAIHDVKVHVPPRFGDERGFFSETYSKRSFADAGIHVDFVQDNHSMSRKRGTLRGLHFQVPPMAQDKLVRVIRGRILDVAVDIRRESPSFGRHVAVELTAEGGEQLFVPKGFAHGFVTLEDDTEVLYKVSAFWSRENEHGLRWNDPALGIDWATPEAEVALNDRDREFPLLADLPAYF